MGYKKPPVLRGLDFSNEEVQQAKEKGKLLRIGIEMTRLCNMRCPYCYANAGKKLQNELSFDELCSVVDQAKTLGAKTAVIFGGGEPLLYGKLFELIDFVNDRGLLPVLFTNGTLLTREIANKLFEKNATVIAKLNSFDATIQDELTGVGGSLDRMKQGIQCLIEAGFNKASPTRLGLETIICKKNYAEIPLIWKFCRERNIFPYFELVKFVGRAKLAKLNISPKKAKRIFNELLKIDRERYGFSWVPMPPGPARSCRQHYHSCYVNSQGNVQPCSGLDVFAGNIRVQLLEEILKGNLFKRMRKTSELLKGGCKTCKYNDRCYGCRGDTFHITGEIFAQDVMCWRCNGRRKHGSD